MVALVVICGSIIWHVIDWYSSGMYLEMAGWADTEKAYLTVLYDLGLIISWGLALGLLMKRITDLVGYGVVGTKDLYDGNGNKYNER